jgi:Zn-dependent protease with chaperone function
MDFFQAQDAARRSTTWLVLLFTLAVIGLILLTNLLVLGFVLYLRQSQDAPPFSLDMVLGYFGSPTSWLVGVGVVVLVGLGSLFRMLQLASGGAVVAESLGGRLVPRDSDSADERKLLNVVEEMAIASGTPVPTVYLLDDSAINAFAAGWTTNDAVVAVTRGAVQQLSRDELQGVVAHEFSHILNGDMRLNIRLVGVLYGILLLGEIGYFMLRSMGRVRVSGSRRGGGGLAAVFVLALGLVTIGYVGTFFGNWIKAVVSRQREFLADASAVQFTRNRDGIAGALKKIGGSTAGSLLLSPAAPQFSHAYFASGISRSWQSAFATHPPLKTRIRRIDPQWDGRFVAPQPPTAPPPTQTSKAQAQAQRRAAVLSGVLATGLGAAVAKTGRPEQAEQDYARDLLAELPPPLHEASTNPHSARAVVYALVLDADAAQQAGQWRMIEAQADDGVAPLTRQLAPLVAELEAAMRLPLIELCLPSLRGLSPAQYERFKGLLSDLMAQDRRIRLSEWVIQHLVLRSLDLAFGLRKPARQTHFVLGSAKPACEAMLSLIAQVEHKDSAVAQQAFAMGRDAIGAGALRFVPQEALDLARLDEAMVELERLKTPLKRRFLEACAASIGMDGTATVTGTELLRTLAGALDCPMPPLVPLSR